ncbi:MAG: hypothetical protein PHI31_07085 [Desulfuromonadaceae bacterium]|nr:hypothetical protein [Desulfuromonadaceae bacterium]
MKRVSLLLAFVCLAILGCGSPTGSTIELQTVSLSVAPGSDRLEADVLIGNSCTTGGGTYTTQTIPIVVTSTPYANASIKSPVTISKITISYSKYDPTSAAPVLPNQYDTGGTIYPGVPKTFDVKVAPDKLLLDLVNTYGLTLCSLDYWEYYVTITFDGVEDIGGKSVTFSTKVKVAFADRNNV